MDLVETPVANDRSTSTDHELIADSLVFNYGKRRALDGVSFRVRRGEIFGFLGPNGGGKTTLFKILATLVLPHEGRVEVCGHDLTTSPSAVRRTLGVVFQSPSSDAQLSLFENLRHQGHIYGLVGKSLNRNIEALLERFSLQDRRDELVRTLSGGLRRRLEIAKALLHEPRLLLLDEPSSGLDPGVRRGLWAMLEELRRDEKVTVLLTTHFMEEADRCDQLALLDEGMIVGRGSPSGLKDEIGGDVVVVMSGDPQRLADEIEARFGISAEIHQDELRLEHPRAHKFVGELADEYSELIESVKVSRPSLEDVFIHRTGRGLEDGRG
jgi:ABC-2 type transport system ATP-binding protein